MATAGGKGYGSHPGYRKIEKPRNGKDAVKDPCEIRVASVGNVVAYISRAGKLFGEMEERKITITATGNALLKAFTTCEILKRRVKGLYQVTTITSEKIVDEYEPIEEGLDPITDSRNMSCVEITLSMDPLDVNAPGYQDPLDPSEVQEVSPQDLIRQKRARVARPKSKSRGRGMPKGGKGGKKGMGKGFGEKGKGKMMDKGGMYGEAAPTSQSGRGGKGKGKMEKGNKGMETGKSYVLKGSYKGYPEEKGYPNQKASGKGNYYITKGKWNDGPPSKGKGKGKKGNQEEYPMYGFHNVYEFDNGSGYGAVSAWNPPGKGKKMSGKGNQNNPMPEWSNNNNNKRMNTNKGKGKGRGATY